MGNYIILYYLAKFAIDLNELKQNTLTYYTYICVCVYVYECVCFCVCIQIGLFEKIYQVYVSVGIVTASRRLNFKSL